MMNKKGITIGRIILYTLFLTILGLLIYSLFLTYKELKKNSSFTDSNTSQVLDFPKFAYNNDFDYSAADYITSYNLVYYSAEDIIYLYNAGIFHLPYIYPYYSYSSNYVVGDNPPYTSYPAYWAVIGEYNYEVFVNNFSLINNGNQLLMGDMFRECISYSADVQYHDYYNTLVNYNYFADFPSSPSSDTGKNSAIMWFNCDIPKNMFSFTVQPGTNFTSNFDFYVVGNESNNAYLCQCSNNRFDYTSLNSALATSTNIVAFGIPVKYSYSNDLSYYFTGRLGNDSYESIMSATDYNPDFYFDIFTHDTNYQDGYNDGFADGVASADRDLVNYNNYLINEIGSLQSNINDLTSRINQQSLIIDSLQNQLNQQQTGFKDLFFIFADIPFKTVHNALGFEFFGVNLFRFFTGVLTALGIVWLIKKIL